MPNQKVYDIIGVGIGPFNLGLAALCASVPELDCLFIEQAESFNWHPGLMLPYARLQVPFYADLVTLTDPRSPFSYMAFLKAKKRMFRFAIQENYFIKRSEYNEYCRWVAGQLTTLQFNTSCNRIEKEGQFFKVKTDKETFLAQKIVMATGTVPFVPEFAPMNNENVLHSSNYLYHKERIIKESAITVVGSGQSAAEIFYDLMQSYQGKLNWFTRSKQFFPMDYSRLTLEMSTPDYIDYFYSLPERKKLEVLASQGALYKGINQALLSDIYDQLKELDSSNIGLNCNCELKKIGEDLTLTFLHIEKEKTFPHTTGAVILSTGYNARVPDCIKPLRPFIQLGNNGMYKANYNYSIDDNNSIFIQNAEHPTHGFNASDLSLGPYRNAVILNTILGREYFTLEKNITFQTFGLPTGVSP